MAYCSSCGNYLDDSAKFCSVCGAQILPAAPAETVKEPVYASAAPTYQYEEGTPVTPVYNAPVEAPRVYEGRPAVSTKTKVLGFVGMGLGIGGLFFGALGALITLIFAFTDGSFAFGYSIGYGIFSWPCSIVGMILCGKSYEEGNPSKVCNIGKKLAVAGLIVSGVMTLFGLIGLIAA